MRNLRIRALMLCCAAFFGSMTIAQAKITEYHLTIKSETVNKTGKELEKITVNGSIPGPVLRFDEGDDAVIHVTNRLDQDSSVHWHGLLLPGVMDGVPGLNGFDGIQPGETYTYRFKIRQNGTYWYHAHSNGQEQDGLYGGIVIQKAQDPAQAQRDYVVLLSDFHEDSSDDIMANLKKSSEYYVSKRRTLGDFFDEARQDGFSAAWKNATEWGEMRMLRTDLADINNYSFLMNGKTQEQNEAFLFRKGERVRLRFINGSAMSFYDVRIPGLKMTVVSADGQNVEPVEIDEFRIGTAETYDVIVTPAEEKAYTIAAETIDRSGFAIGTLAPKAGMKGAPPVARKMSLLTMRDMGNMPGMKHDMSGMKHDMPMDHDMSMMQSGWKDRGTPKGDKALEYSDLRTLVKRENTAKPGREIALRLGGNMERYIWTINGKKHNESEPITIRYGETVTLKFINETMMAHPMHLHGMFFRLNNGQSPANAPNKHTVIVPPGDEYSVTLTADEPGEWAIHCHLLYHMISGMMGSVTVEKQPSSGSVTPEKQISGMQEKINSVQGGEHEHH